MHHTLEKRPMVSLQKQLRQLGYDGDFRDLLADLFAATYPSWNDEKLTRNPKEALAYCELVRQRTNLRLADEFILGALAGIRKHTIKV